MWWCSWYRTSRYLTYASKSIESWTTFASDTFKQSCEHLFLQFLSVERPESAANGPEISKLRELKPPDQPNLSKLFAVQQFQVIIPTTLLSCFRLQNQVSPQEKSMQPSFAHFTRRSNLLYSLSWVGIRPSIVLKIMGVLEKFSPMIFFPADHLFLLISNTPKVSTPFILNLSNLNEK